MHACIHTHILMIFGWSNDINNPTIYTHTYTYIQTFIHTHILIIYGWSNDINNPTIYIHTYTSDHFLDQNLFVYIHIHT